MDFKYNGLWNVVFGGENKCGNTPKQQESYDTNSSKWKDKYENTNAAIIDSLFKQHEVTNYNYEQLTRFCGEAKNSNDSFVHVDLYTSSEKNLCFVLVNIELTPQEKRETLLRLIQNADDEHVNYLYNIICEAGFEKGVTKTSKTLFNNIDWNLVQLSPDYTTLYQYFNLTDTLLKQFIKQWFLKLNLTNEV